MSTVFESHKDLLRQTLKVAQHDLQLEERRQAEMMTQQAELHTLWIQQQRQQEEQQRQQLSENARLHKALFGVMADLVKVVREKR